PLFVMKALQNGLDGVWVSGCHPGDCHYQTGNYYARRKFALTKKLSEFMGIKPERITFSWIAASEGQKIAETASKVVEGLTRIGKNELFSKNESQG
ncbi:MAG: hydrogenase iron-sulfur subunit, partial [Thermodesulfobacteriota bacterium]|nr:hydrogenase iron-sulfur subunit [Thermodesulfobacteriota bacterium]